MSFLQDHRFIQSQNGQFWRARHRFFRLRQDLITDGCNDSLKSKIQQDMMAQLVASFLPYDQFILSTGPDRLDRWDAFRLIFSSCLSSIREPLFRSCGYFFLKKEIPIRRSVSSSLKYLTADREFIGAEWFRYLIHHGIKFRLRIKKNMNLSRSNGQFSPAVNFFRSASFSCLVGRRLVCGYLLCVTGMRLPSVIISSLHLMMNQIKSC